MIENTKRVEYSRRFQKQLKRAPIEIKIAFLDRRDVFNQDPFQPQLNNHKLSGSLSNLRSINITGDWRAIYSETKTVIIFEMLGTHSELYKN
ncbi:MAG: hypothetical protein A3F33_03040 [Candidatus Woykebacteria bacterium RIFCSPHIGHO2_12_FULL_43_10]|uniref:Type II toxin-antitoxin system mRNA interferase toxin, RelE/StbE family n=2 Tax=Candidatus Woykeibacteriota TaxID=1817899 RepID=A0A1G1WY25_9BACT|nr:MAG: hypothetical protein A2802_01665 [Candidatus Woykebacteria bacterium RIFCSPHIGHO2_01_FULL_43_29]OGY28721.1 MAG: hypothetical protein A3J50_01245 [Candidatus Woykebacteria bacterium RIFCSPHIGHO2_02_FULL_43_16b]OGY29797.1 MAG: hypothetical protein A3F33_03040 [Candidatus Woykebacteria bacterium RIFCSPHIGHO2_12_FULL_43_10]OGY32471.1 MAG: hypothetical protein A3A61_00770 [Candidatus Woykebacteria bacterium RIFCSPLOWO2_01_FULL_43_14]